MTNPKDNMEWLVDKINRKLKMFLKGKNISYLEKAESLLEDLKEEYSLYLSWRALNESRGISPKKEEG